LYDLQPDESDSIDIFGDLDNPQAAPNLALRDSGYVARQTTNRHCRFAARDDWHGCTIGRYYFCQMREPLRRS